MGVILGTRVAPIGDPLFVTASAPHWVVVEARGEPYKPPPNPQYAAVIVNRKQGQFSSKGFQMLQNVFRTKEIDSLVLARIFCDLVLQCTSSSVWNLGIFLRGDCRLNVDVILIYRVFKIFAPPSRAKSKKASVKLTISTSNTFDLKWGRKKLAPKTFQHCCKINFPKMRFCMEMVGISSI